MRWVHRLGAGHEGMYVFFWVSVWSSCPGRLYGNKGLGCGRRENWYLVLALLGVCARKVGVSKVDPLRWDDASLWWLYHAVVASVGFGGGWEGRERGASQQAQAGKGASQASTRQSGIVQHDSGRIIGRHNSDSIMLVRLIDNFNQYH